MPPISGKTDGHTRVVPDTPPRRSVMEALAVRRLRTRGGTTRPNASLVPRMTMGAMSFKRRYPMPDASTSNRYYITTSIPYVNGTPHIGFSLEVIQWDALSLIHI